MLPSRPSRLRNSLRPKPRPEVSAWRPASPALILPRFSPAVPQYHQRPSGAGHEIVQAVAELLVRRGHMRRYDTSVPLDANLATALEGWAVASGLFHGLRFLQCRLSVREFGMDWEFDGRTTPYVGFALQARNVEHVYVGRVLHQLHSFDPFLPAALMHLVANGTHGVQLWDFPFLLYSAESYYWFGEHEQASVLATLKGEIGEEFNTDEHLLPDGFFRDFPRWLFPQFANGANLAEVRRRFVVAPPTEFKNVAAAAGDLARGQCGTGKRLRTPFWDDLCEGGADLAPLAILRMNADDCGGRIVDDHEQNQGNGEGFVDLCGGFSGGAADTAALTRAWRNTCRQLALVKKLDALLVTLAAED